METQERDSGQPWAGLAVASFVFDRSQRTRGTTGSVYVTRGDNKCQFDEEGAEPSASPSPEATADPFSNPSPVTSQDVGKSSCKPLQSPTESSDSSPNGSEPKARQQRRITPTLFLPLNGEGQDKGVLKPHVEAGGGGITGGGDEGVLSLCQKTWGPSDNPFVKQQQSRSNWRPSLYRRPSLSCPNSPTDASSAFLNELENNMVVGVQATRYGSNRFSQCVMAGILHFPEIDHYANWGDYAKIYSIEAGVRSINYEEMKFLYSGGNGTVYSYGNYAIKETKYCEQILNIVREFDHPNLVRLLGVTLLGPFSQVCFLVMPLMTYDLHRALIQPGTSALRETTEKKTLHHRITLVQLAKGSSEETWTIIKSNVKYTMKEILKALSYMGDKCVQHGDIKGCCLRLDERGDDFFLNAEKNILIKKTCECFDILHCTCSIDSGAKYRVFVTDYDYVRKCHSKATNLFYHHENCCVQEYTGGTLPYRAPEESIVMSCHGESPRRLGGHCSDVYSFGVLLLRLCVGEGAWKYYFNANIVAGQLNALQLAPESEAVFNLQMLNKLNEAARRCRGSRMDFLADLVTQCIQPNPSDRPTAYELLKKVEALLFYVSGYYCARAEASEL